MIIELSNFNGGKPIFVNSNHIVSIAPDVGEGTVLTMRQGFHRVREDASAIAATINDFLAPVAAVSAAEEVTIDVAEEAPKTVGRPTKKAGNVKKTD